jgi:hypothetical protein
MEAEMRDRRWGWVRHGGLIVAAMTGLAGPVSAGGHHADVKIKVVQRSGTPMMINVSNGVVSVSSGSAVVNPAGAVSSAPVMFVTTGSGTSSAPAASAPASAAPAAPSNTIKIKSGTGVVEIDRSILATAGNGVSSAPSTALSAPSTGQTYILVSPNGAGQYQLQSAPAAPAQSAPAQYQIVAAPATQTQAAPVQYQIVSAPATQIQASPVQYQILAAPSAKTQSAPVQYQILAAPANQVSATSGGSVIYYVQPRKHGLFH